MSKWIGQAKVIFLHSTGTPADRGSRTMSANAGKSMAYSLIRQLFSVGMPQVLSNFARIQVVLITELRDIAIKAYAQKKKKRNSSRASARGEWFFLSKKFRGSKMKTAGYEAMFRAMNPTQTLAGATYLAVKRK